MRLISPKKERENPDQSQEDGGPESSTHSVALKESGPGGGRTELPPQGSKCPASAKSPAKSLALSSTSFWIRWSH